MKEFWPYIIVAVMSMLSGGALYYALFVPHDQTPVHAPDVVIPPVQVPDTNHNAILAWAWMRINQLESQKPETLIVGKECRHIVDSLQAELAVAWSALGDALEEAKAETTIVLGDTLGPNVIFQHRMRFQPWTRQFFPEFLGIEFSRPDPPPRPKLLAAFDLFGDVYGGWALSGKKPVAGIGAGLRVWTGENVAMRVRAGLDWMPGLENIDRVITGGLEYHVGGR